MEADESAVNPDRLWYIGGIFPQWDIPGIFMVYSLYPSNIPLGYFGVMCCEKDEFVETAQRAVAHCDKLGDRKAREGLIGPRRQTPSSVQTDLRVALMMHEAFRTRGGFIDYRKALIWHTLKARTDS